MVVEVSAWKVSQRNYEKTRSVIYQMLNEMIVLEDGTTTTKLERTIERIRAFCPEGGVSGCFFRRKG